MSEQKQDAWAIVELMGHVRLAGRLTEEEKFGTKMGRLDIPNPPKPDCLACKGTGVIQESRTTGPENEEHVEPAHRCRMPDYNSFTTQLFGGASVYRITIVSEDVA